MIKVSYDNVPHRVYYIILYHRQFADVALTCPACPRMFASKQGLSHHCTVVHKSPIETLEQDKRCFFFTIILCQLPCTTGDCTDIRFRWRGPPPREKDLHVMMTPGRFLKCCLSLQLNGSHSLRHQRPCLVGVQMHYYALINVTISM